MTTCVLRSGTVSIDYVRVYIILPINVPLKYFLY